MGRLSRYSAYCLVGVLAVSSGCSRQIEPTSLEAKVASRTAFEDAIVLYMGGVDATRKKDFDIAKTRFQASLALIEGQDKYKQFHNHVMAEFGLYWLEYGEHRKSQGFNVFNLREALFTHLRKAGENKVYYYVLGRWSEYLGHLPLAEKAYSKVSDFELTFPSGVHLSKRANTLDDDANKRLLRIQKTLKKQQEKQELLEFERHFT